MSDHQRDYDYPPHHNPRPGQSDLFDRVVTYLNTRTLEHWMFLLVGLAAGAILG